MERRIITNISFAMKKTAIISTLMLAMPAIALAQDANIILLKVGVILGQATPLVVALAVLFFFWGLAMYILNAGDEEKRDKGRSIMIWGVIALFVMVSVWGLVRIIGNTFGVTEGGSVMLPTIPTINR